MTSSTTCRLRRAAGGLSAAGGWLLVWAGTVLAQCADGSCRPENAPHAAVVRIANAGSGGTSYGSGTLVQKGDGRGLVLSCAHLFRQGTGEVSVLFRDGRRHAARVMAIDGAWDLAAVEIAEPAAAPATIAETPPQPGDLLQSCGFGPDGRYGCNQGRALGYARTLAGTTHETLTLSGAAREGDSGGPVFNGRGELVAVVWGTDGRTVEGTYCGRIRRFLAGLLAPGRRPAPLRPVPPGASPPDTAPPFESRPPGSGSLLEEIRGRLESQGQVLGERIGKIEAAVGAENLRTLVREVAGGIVGEAAPGLLEKVLPVALGALGWTAPPSLALILGIRLAAGILKRRAVRRKRDAAGRPGAERAKPATYDQYAKQLAGVYALSGRSPVADATLGREYDEELRRTEESSDAGLARWARGLRERVARRFYRIHSEAPLPAEPPGERQTEGGRQ